MKRNEMLEKENEELYEDKRLLKEKVLSCSKDTHQLDIQLLKNSVNNKDEEIDLLKKENKNLTDKIKHYEIKLRTLMSDLKNNRDFTNQNLNFLKENVAKPIESKVIPQWEKLFVEELEILPSIKEITSNYDNEEKSWLKTTRISEVQENEKNIFQLPEILDNDKFSNQNEISTRIQEEEKEEKDNNKHNQFKTKNEYILTKSCSNTENSENRISNSHINDSDGKLRQNNGKFEMVNFEYKGKIF